MLKKRLIPIVLACTFVPHAVPAQGSQSGYKLPPAEVVEIIDALPNPDLQLSPDKVWMLSVQGSAMPSIADLSRRMLRLAGTRIDPAADSRYRTNFNSDLTLSARGLADSKWEIPLAQGARLSSVTWSHDSEHFAYVIETDRGSRLYGTSVIEIGKRQAPRLLTDRLNTVTGGVTWMPDGKTLLARLVPIKRGAEPVLTTTPSGPNIREAGGDTSPLRTYQDLLSS
ncbi:MAG: hypothetical protein ACI9F9_001590, partial [Candidatus Paceibacteria bacterium]